jgi:hypothetical protein
MQGQVRRIKDAFWALSRCGSLKRRAKIMPKMAPAILLMPAQRFGERQYFHLPVRRSMMA